MDRTHISSQMAYYQTERVGGGGSSENEVPKRKEDTLDPSAGEGTGQE